MRKLFLQVAFFLAVVGALSLASAGQLQYTLLTLALPIVAGLDAVRRQWARLPFATVYFGGALFLLSMIPIGWTLAVNPYLGNHRPHSKQTRSRRDHLRDP